MRKQAVFWGALLIALIASIPTMVDYIILGEELEFYLMGIEALGFRGSSIIDVYKWFVVALNLATVWSAYISFKGCFGHEEIGLFGAALYTLSPYRLHIVYNRAAVGEYTAMLFLPLLVWGCYGLYRSKRMEKKGLRNLALAIIGLAGTYFFYILQAKSKDFLDVENHIADMASDSVGVVLLICVLLWIGMVVKCGKTALSKEQKKERSAANIALILACILLVISAYTGIAVCCLVFTACVMGLWTLQNKPEFISGKTILIVIALAAVLVGNYHVNDILMNGEEFLREYSSVETDIAE